MSRICPYLRRHLQDPLQMRVFMSLRQGLHRFAPTATRAAVATSERGCEGRADQRRSKRPQTSAALKFPAVSDETSSEPYHPATPTDRRSAMPLSAPAAQPRSERQLVFTSSQAARYVGVSLATVRRWTDAGHISCYRTPGGQRRFSRAQLDEFIASMQRTGPVEEVAVVTQADAQVA
jgi:excisionase family DNA binding protein